MTRYITELSKELDQAGNWIYPDRWRDATIPELLRMRREAMQPNAPTIGTGGDPNEPGYPETFEEFFITRTSEGQRALTRYKAEHFPTPEQSRTLATFYANVKARLHNGK